MKKFGIFLGLTALAAAFTGCEEPLECDVKATLWVVNYTVCTPNIEVEGDVVAYDLGYDDSVSVELNEGTYDIVADLPLITLCTEQSTTINSVCGETYRWVIE